MFDTLLPPCLHTVNIRGTPVWAFALDLRWSIAFALTKNRKRMRKIVDAHVSDELSQELAEQIVQHLQLTFEVDDEAGCLLRKPALQGHGGGRL